MGALEIPNTNTKTQDGSGLLVVRGAFPWALALGFGLYSLVQCIQPARKKTHITLMTAAVQWQKINGRAATRFSRGHFFTNVQCFLETKKWRPYAVRARTVTEKSLLMGIWCDCLIQPPGCLPYPINDSDINTAHKPYETTHPGFETYRHS